MSNTKKICIEVEVHSALEITNVSVHGPISGSAYLTGDVPFKALPAPPSEALIPEGYTAVKTDVLLWLLCENGEFVCPPEKYFRDKPATYFWRSALRAAMLTTPQANAELQIPEGYALVPIEPTPEMENVAAFNLCVEFGLKLTEVNRAFALAAYRELVKAAPSTGDK